MSVQPSTSRAQRRPAYNLNAPEDARRFIELVKQHPSLLERISMERLLPEWQKLIPVTGVSAHVMISKWNRLCTKYRYELRLEKEKPSGSFKSKWIHFDQMAFARSIEEKRMRVNKRPPPVVEATFIKLEPVSPPSSPKKPRSLAVGMPNKPKPVSTSTKPSMVVRNGQQRHEQPKKLTPSERVLMKEPNQTGVGNQPKMMGYMKQAIKEDLQQQASRVVASRNMSVQRIPITNLSVAGMRDALDNDYDFLMIRIYPLLSVMPLEAKRVCYERMQAFVVNMYKNFNPTRCKFPIPYRHIP